MSGVMIRHLLSRAAPGQIVNIASVAGRVDYQARSAYCRVEVRGHRVTQVMAPELAEHRITVNAECTGAIATDRNDATRRRAQGAGNPGTVIAHSSPVGRLGVPADVASTVRFLVDPVAGYITGSPMLSPAGCTRPDRCIHVAVKPDLLVRPLATGRMRPWTNPLPCASPPR
jgi:NAD(P)-dependent dehydrogenase (short-subunit alcohol dehydrogenase family)